MHSLADVPPKPPVPTKHEYVHGPLMPNIPTHHWAGRAILTFGPRRSLGIFGGLTIVLVVQDMQLFIHAVKPQPGVSKDAGKELVDPNNSRQGVMDGIMSR